MNEQVSVMLVTKKVNERTAEISTLTTEKKQKVKLGMVIEVSISTLPLVFKA